MNKAESFRHSGSSTPPMTMVITRDGLIGKPGGEFMSPKELLIKRIQDKDFALSERVPLNRGNLGLSKAVANHELNHVELALQENVPFSIVSVIPEGNSLGRTIFPYSIPKEKRAIIAAGGVVDGHGFGSDQMQMFFSLLSPSSEYGYTNDDIDRAWNAVASVTDHAANRLGQKNEIKEREAEILAYLGEADMKTYFEIQNRAVFEQQVKDFGLESLLSEATSGIIRKENYFIRPDNFIATSVYGPGVKVVETYIEGKLTSWLCKCCGNRDGNHSPNCLVNNEKWKENYRKIFRRPFDWKNPFDNGKDENNKGLEKSGIIFEEDSNSS